MGELIRKELRSFFSSLSGYVVLFFFLLTNGLFLWVIPGSYNIFDSDMADMQPFFALAPLLYLFLVPAICMRLFAEERRVGTLELLFTRPVSMWHIVVAKYWAGFILVLLSILPTFIYVVSLWILAQPTGYIDMGGIIGSYIGLLFLSGIYVAVGVWASAQTDNQIISFLYALVISFLLYTGIDFLGEILIFADFQANIQALGINDHYEPMSRGVIAFSDVVYFISFIFLFLYLTVRRFKGTHLKWWYIVVALLVLNFGVTKVYWQLDITNDKRYTMSDNTKELIKQVDRPIRVEIFLAGNLPPDMQKLQYSITRMLEEFRRISGNNFRYDIINPTELESLDEKKAISKYLTEKGIMPMNITRRTNDETLLQQYIFPGMTVYDAETVVAINLLQDIPGQTEEQNLIHSIEALEYELTKAVRLLMREEIKSVAFLTDHGEPPYQELMNMAELLSYFYQVDFVSPDSLAIDLLRYQALIIARPTTDFSERDKFIIDQYAMNGGSILWCIDEVVVDHESLKTQGTAMAIPHPRPLNLKDMLFRYGVRINPDLLLDGSCVRIPIRTGMNGNTPIYNLGAWYYSPLLHARQAHPITTALLPVRVDYASSIDTVGGNDGLKKTVLLSTSQYAAAMKAPCPVMLSVTEEKMTPEKFNRQFIPVAVAVEGDFKSLFQYRNMSGVVDMPFKSESDYNRMIFISDGDIIRNKVRGVGENAITVPLGYDEYSGQMYGNRDFILNSINWLCDDDGWMQLRARKVSLYLLDKTRLKAERTMWEMLNLLLPLVVVAAIGGVFALTRRK